MTNKNKQKQLLGTMEKEIMSEADATITCSLTMLQGRTLQKELNNNLWTSVW